MILSRGEVASRPTSLEMRDAWRAANVPDSIRFGGLKQNQETDMPARGDLFWGCGE